MDTVIRNINLHGKQNENSISDIEDWINDTANKLNLLLNGPSNTDEEQAKEKKTSIEDTILETGETVRGTCKGTIPVSKCFWRKWKSGILEIWGYRRSNNIVFVESPWGGYESRVETGTETLRRIGTWGTWPIEFTDIPAVSYQVATSQEKDLSGDYEFIHSQFNLEGELTDLHTESPYFKIWRGTEVMMYNPTITFHAIGHWK